jgi:DNA polymerase III subunit chi
MATRVDFYVLESADDRARLVYACRLIDEACKQRQTVCVTLDTAAAADAFDALLWTYDEQSFVPHVLAPDAAASAGMPPQTPVHVGCAVPVAADLLVNLGHDVPAFYDRYARVVDLVDADAARRDAGRRRFAKYRDRGHTPETHKVSA